MKAISLWQPWASLMAVGAKRIETRSWSTDYRGPLAICAAKTWNQQCDRALYQPAFKRALAGNPNAKAEQTRASLPFGKILCIVEVFDCQRVELVEAEAARGDEYWFGDYSQGRFAWLTRNLVKLPEPLPVTGRQGFFNLSPDLVRQIEAQLGIGSKG